MFICEIRQTWLPIIIFILLSVGVVIMSQTWKVVIISILFVMGITIMFSTLGYTILMHWFARKRFSFHHCLLIKVHREMGQTWILLIISILFAIALQSCSSHWDTRYWCFDLERKAFLWNKTEKVSPMESSFFQR